jgi:hypothetical protein
MIIFEILLCTFKTSVIFEAAGEVVKISSSLKPNRHNQYLPCANISNDNDISKYFKVGFNKHNCPKINISIHKGKKYWLKNVFLLQYRNISSKNI